MQTRIKVELEWLKNSLTAADRGQSRNLYICFGNCADYPTPTDAYVDLKNLSDALREYFRNTDS